MKRSMVCRQAVSRMMGATPLPFRGNTPLKEADPVIYDLIQREKARQFSGLELIASENQTSRAVMECLGSVLVNKYSEGQPGSRYYGGNEIIDKVENLCKERALEIFGLDGEEWGVNVQPLSGAPANIAVLNAALKPHDRLMGLDLPCGGHLTHGFYTPSKRVSVSSLFYESLPYRTNPDGLIDFEGLEKAALLYRPKLIICGASAYPRAIDFAKFREIADKVGAMLMADVAHISGLIAGGNHASPFDHADFITTTTHKVLRGPRAGLIYTRRRHLGSGEPTGWVEAVDNSVFPGLQGGPHQNQIAAVATQLKEVLSPEWPAYTKQVCDNAAHLAGFLTENGMQLVTGGTDNHILLWDLTPQKLSGGKMEAILEAAHISVNKNTVPGDKSAMNPGGIRIGTPAVTTRGLVEKDIEEVGHFLLRAHNLALGIQKEGAKKLVDFRKAIRDRPEVEQLAADVKSFSEAFPLPGHFDE